MGILPIYGGLLVKHITISQLRERIQKEELTILDVRSQNEWSSGHIEGSINISVNNLMSNKNKIPVDKPIVVICRSGSRSNLAAMMLDKLGKHSIYNVPAGVSGWKRSSFPLVTS